MSRALRNVPADFDPSVVAAIDERLDEVEQVHGVRILLAIESGSRAWGFPSPDSDYDCRFLYVRSVEQYLSPWTRRDVIETPLDPVLDVNGWDVGKAIKLVLKGNAVAIEWLQSTITYRGDAAFRDALLGFATRHADRPAVARHYLHLGARQLRTYFADGKEVALKKVFYALRPAVSLRWLRLHGSEALAPMHFPALVAQSGVPDEIGAIVQDLLIRKAQTNELGKAPLPAPIRKFIEAEFLMAADAFPARSEPRSQSDVEAAESLFRRFLS